MASYIWNGGSGGWGTIANWTGGIPNSTIADATIAAGGNYTVTVETGDTYTIDSVSVTDSGAVLDIVGTLSLSGALALATFSTGTLELQGQLAGGTVDINGSSTLIAAGGALKNNAGFYQGGSAYIALAGNTLNLGGTSTLQGYITGPGELIISGLATLTDDPYFEAGTTLDDTGTIVLASNTQFGNNGAAQTDLIIGAGALFDITVNSGWGDNGSLNVTNAGLFEMTAAAANYNLYYNSFGNTGTLSIVSGSDIAFYGATLGLGGTVLGPGELYLGNGNGTVSLESGLVMNTGTVILAGGDSVVLEANLAIGTDFVATYNSNLDLNGLNLTLTGASGAVRGYVYGGGTLDIAGTADVGGLYLAAGTEELITGTAIDDYNGRLDFNNASTPSILSIASTGTYDITEINGQIDYNGPLGTFINSGLLENISTTASYFNLFENYTNASTGTLFVGSGDDISIIRGQNILAGTLTGAGSVFLGQGGTTSLESALVLNTAYLTISDGNTNVILESNRTYAGTLDLISGAVLSLNNTTFALTGAGTNLDAYVNGPGTLVIAGTANADFYLQSGAEELVTGLAIDAYGNTRLDYDNGTAASILSIATTGTYDVAVVNSYMDYNGKIGTVINAGLFEATETQSSYFNLEENYTNASTGTISINAGDGISLIYGHDSLAGTIEGLGGLYIGNGATASLAGALLLNIAYLTISDGNTDVILGGNTNFANEFTEQNSADLSLNGNTLTVSGSGALDGYISGPGTVDVTGTYNTDQYVSSGVTEVLTGTEYQVSTVYMDDDSGAAPSVFSIAAGGVYDLTGDYVIYNGGNNGNGTGSIVNAGLFEKTALDSYSNEYENFINLAAGTISIIAFNQISLLEGQNQLGGTVTGQGELYLGSGSHTTLEAGLALSITELVLSDGNTALYLTGNQTFTNTFVLQNSAVLYTSGHTFSLTGLADLNNAYIAGPGAVNVTGTGDVSNLILTEKAVLLDSGTLVEQNGFQIGNGSSDSAQMTVATHAVFDMLNNNGISTNGTAAISNDGLFEKTGDNGNSQVNPRFNNAASGTIDAVDGVISFGGGGSLGGTIEGAGQVNLTGGTFTLAAKAVVDVGVFAIDGGILDLIGNHSIASVFEDVNNDVDLSAFNLTIGQGYLENAYLTGPGALIVSGSVLLDNFYINTDSRLIDTGSITQQANFYLGGYSSDNVALSITTAGIYDLVDNGGIYANGGLDTVVNTGLLEKTGDDSTSNINISFTNTSQGTINAAYGDLAFNAGSIFDKLGGTLTGAGEIDLDNNNILLSAKSVSVAVLEINASPTLGNNIAYAGSFYLNPNDGLDLNGYTLTLTGIDHLQGGFSGAGTVTVGGTGLVDLLNIAGGSELIDTGLLEQVNQLRFGYYYDGTQNTLAIAAGGTYDILNDTGFADFINGTAAAYVFNSGLLEKTSGAGISEIQPTITNTGTVLAASGTIRLDNPADLVNGTLTQGTWEAAGGSLLFEAADPIIIDAANIIIAGAASNIFSGPNAGTSLASSLTSIATGGTLQLIKAAPFTDALKDAGTLVVSGGTVSNITVVGGGISYIDAGAMAIATVVDSGGVQIINNNGKAKNAVINSGGAETIASGGLATSTTVESFGSSTVFSGGVASNVTIASGMFDLLSGGTASGFIDFTGTGGELIIGAATMPTTTISGFAAGDTIDLAGVVYSAGATVTVATAGIVSILDGNHTYSLNIAGATVGETDFLFSPGALLTKTGGQQHRMTFIAPASATSASAASLLPAATPVNSAPAATSITQPAPLGATADLLTKVPAGGSEILAVTLSAWG